MSLEFGLEVLDIEDVVQGYHEEERFFTCLACGRQFDKEEVFPIEGRFFEAVAAVKKHRQTEHADYFEQLLGDNNKYAVLTQNQKELLTLFRSGLTDGKVAKVQGVAPSTVRHQRFQFREKAKQAKMYLALYTMAMEDAGKDKNRKEDFIMVHDSARQLDERYVTTESEKEKIADTFFLSRAPLKLISLPAREKKKVVVLGIIANQFAPRTIYAEKDVNATLGDIYDDYASLRRYLIEYGFLDRKSDCSEYWRK